MQARWLEHPPSDYLLPWLRSRGSLTARLQANGCFAVVPGRRGLLMATADEARLLRLSRPQRVYVREVQLLVDGVPRVLARSLTPLRGLRRSWGAVRGLGTRPLGAALWSNPRVQRGCMRYATLRQLHSLYRHLQHEFSQLPPRLPARRSCFWLAGQPLLVMEAFLPAVQALDASMTRQRGASVRPGRQPVRGELAA